MLAVVVVLSMQPACALAAAAGHSVVLGFGSGYATPEGTTAVHRGVDIAVDPGERFESVVDGAVTFAGRVPGPHGGSVLAVTVASAQGKVSMMPFDQLLVAKGDAVAVGSSIGRVSAEGDPSTSQPHVHLSLRKEDLYVDPTVLLVAPQSAVTPEPEPVESPAVSVSPAPGMAPAPVVAPAPATGLSGALAPSGASAVSAPAAVPLGAGVSVAPSAQPVRAGARATVTGEAASSGVSVTPGDLVGSGVEVVPASPISADALQGAAQVQTPLQMLLKRAYTSARVAAALMAQYALTSALVIAAALAAAGVLLSRRAMARRITSEASVSHRWGTLLQQLRTGDRLRGFTPAPGRCLHSPGAVQPRGGD